MAIIRGNRTLGDLKNAHKTLNSFNKAMRMDAKDRYLKNGGELICKICGKKVDLHICHIKHINKFPLDTTIEDVNGSHNTLCLCSEHHKLYDQGEVEL